MPRMCCVHGLDNDVRRHCAGQPIVYPRNELSYSENFLHMMFSVPTERYDVDPVLSRALEIILILHMDHEQNASTSTVRVAGQCTEKKRKDCTFWH